MTTLRKALIRCGAIGIFLTGLLVGHATMPVRAQTAQIRVNNNTMGLFIDPPTTRYHNFGATLGANGFGIRENAGVMESKDDAGAWAAFGGAISISGTPVNNQVAIWTDADTLEGDANLTFDGADLLLGSAIQLVVDDGTLADPGIRGSDANSGFYLTDNGRNLNYGRDGVNLLLISGIDAVFNANIYLSDGGDFHGWRNTGTTLYSDANDVLDMRRTTNAQTINIYGTFAGTTDYERVSVGHNGTDAFITGETDGAGDDNFDVVVTAAGTGVVRAASPFVSFREVEVVTGTKTTTLAESGEVYTNTGDADGSTYTLLNDPTIGVQWTFVAMEAQTMTISPSTGETIEADGSVCADVRIGAAVGESLTLIAAEGGAGGVFTPIASHGGFTCTP